MWALTLLTVLQAARANSCVRITIGTDESGAKTVSKSFAITARSPEACKKNHGELADGEHVHVHGAEDVE